MSKTNVKVQMKHLAVPMNWEWSKTILPALTQFLWNLTFISSASHGKLFLVLFQVNEYPYLQLLENAKRTVIYLKLFDFLSDFVLKAYKNDMFIFTYLPCGVSYDTYLSSVSRGTITGKTIFPESRKLNSFFFFGNSRPPFLLGLHKFRLLISNRNWTKWRFW